METADKPLIAPKKRIWELDFLRGFLVLLMVVDHLFITVCFFFGPAWFIAAGGDGANGFVKFYESAVFYVNHPAREIIQPVVVMIFIMLCGLSTGFSRSNAKRGCILAIIALILTMITRAMPDQSMFISFGILHMLAFCILNWSIIAVITKDNKKTNLIIGLSLFFLVAGLYAATSFNGDFKLKLSHTLFFFIQTDETFAMSPGDFYPLIPWTGIFFAAAAVSPYLYPDKLSLLPSLDGKWNKPICFIGRHTLIIYIVHIVFVVASLELAGYFGFKEWFLSQLF